MDSEIPPCFAFLAELQLKAYLKWFPTLSLQENVKKKKKEKVLAGKTVLQ